MADTTGAIDLSMYLMKEEHKNTPDMHRMGVVLPYADSVMPANPRKGAVGDGDTVAASNHVHANAPVYIRPDSVAGADDHLFTDQLSALPTSILQGTMVGTLDPFGDTTKRLLCVRYQDDWYAITLTRDTIITGGHSFTSVNQDNM